MPDHGRLGWRAAGLLLLIALACPKCKAQNQTAAELPDPMSLPCGKTFRVATHDFPPFIIVDKTKCVNQVCGMEAFGCTQVGCDKGGITYRLVETELKAELQKQCRAISQSEEFSKIQFQWILPPESPESASSAVNMVCNGDLTSSNVQLVGKVCKSTVKTEAGYYKGPTSTADFAATCTAIEDTGCKSMGPDFAAGSIQMLVDRMALVHFTTPFLTTPQQVATRATHEPPFFANVIDKMALFFGPFTLELWIAILVEVLIVTVIFLFIESSVNDDIAEGFTSIPDTFYWSFTTVLGGADKAPVSIGGKTVFVAHAIFAMIIGATYTGAVASFLISTSNIPTVDDFDSLATGKFGIAVRGPKFDSSDPQNKFLGVWNGGTANNKTLPSSQFLQFQAIMQADSATSFSMFTYKSILTKKPDDTNWVYDKKTSPCKDKKNELGVLDAVLCGTDEEGPEALVHDYHALIYELNKRKKIDNYCKLVTRGPAVNPSGIALAFPHGTDMHIPFSKAILNILAQDGITSILRQKEFEIDRNHCEAPVVNAAQMTFRLFIIAFAGFLVALIIGKVERFFYFRGKEGEDGEEEEDTDEATIAVPGAAEEENVNEEYECISGLLDELGDQMGRIEGLSSKLADLREKAEGMGALKTRPPAAEAEAKTSQEPSKQVFGAGWFG